MLNKSTVIVFTIVYIIAFHKDYKNCVTQARKFEKQEAKQKKPTFRDLPIGRLRKNDVQNIGPVAGSIDGKTTPGYLRLVNQVHRLNVSNMQLKKKMLSQNKTMFHKDMMLKRHEEEIRCQKEKIKIYKAQLNKYKLKLNNDKASNISLTSEEENKSKKMQNLGDKELDSSLEKILLTTPTNLTVQNIMVQNTTIQNTIENTMVQSTMLQ